MTLSTSFSPALAYFLALNTCLAQVELSKAPSPPTRLAESLVSSHRSRLDGFTSLESPILTGSLSHSTHSSETVIFPYPQALSPQTLSGVAVTERLKTIARDLSVRQIASLLGVTHTMVYGWLRGEPITAERFETAQRVADVLEAISGNASGRLAETLFTKTTIGLSPAELIRLKEFDAAVGASSIIEGSVDVPAFGEGLDLASSLAIQPWTKKAGSAQDISAFIFEDDLTPAFEPEPDDAIVWQGVAVG